MADKKIPGFKRRSIRITLITLCVYGLLVATHEGEFWPFSIYPMFSQAGNPWTRAMITDMTDVPDSLKWESAHPDDVPGTPVPVREYGVDQIDFSNFITKTDDWNSQRRQALVRMFGSENLQGREWMVMKVSGRMTEGREVIMDATPFLLLTADSVYTNPTAALGIEYRSE